jgi:hypothetical protein
MYARMSHSLSLAFPRFPSLSLGLSPDTCIYIHICIHGCFSRGNPVLQQIADSPRIALVLVFLRPFPSLVIPRQPIETERTVSCIAIQLVKGGPGVLDMSAPGYSPPLVADESALVSPENIGAMDAADRDRGRGAARGGGRPGSRGGGTGGRGRGGAGSAPGGARGARGGSHRRGSRAHGSGSSAPANGSGSATHAENGNGAASRTSAPADPKHASSARPASATSAAQHSSE